MQKKTDQRESLYVHFARLAYALAQQVLPRYAHPQSPHHYTLPQLAACVLLKIYRNAPYRDTEEWLRASAEVREALELTRVPDHATLARAFAKIPTALWRQMNDTLLQQLGVQEDLVATDTTGFQDTQASAPSRSRSGRPYRLWDKAGFVVGTRSQFVLGMTTGRGLCSDIHWLPSLRRQAQRYVPRAGRLVCVWLVADKGFDGQTVTWTDGIPPIRRGRRLRSWVRQLRAELVARLRAAGIYGQRWKSETVISVIKRKFGEGVRSRLGWLARRELVVKGLVYNLYR